jgi:hypothetical protein
MLRRVLIHLEKSLRTFSPSGADESVAVTLMRHGYIPPTPSSPSCAIHIDVLRYCAALRRHASSISLQGIASSICEVHNVECFPNCSVVAAHCIVDRLHSALPDATVGGARRLFGGGAQG